MAISEFEIKRVEKIMEDYLTRTRPPVHIRNELDIGYRIENQSVELFEIRPAFKDPNTKIEHAIAKATYVKRDGIWKIYWMRADLKWHGYEPVPDARDLEEFLSVIGDDHYGCFYG
jgi:Protein of unknown function (DUF3024)